MQENKAAIINVSKGLLNISLATLAVVGGTTGNPFVVAATALPQTIAASGLLKPLFERKQEEKLVLPVPSWWTGDPPFQSWQNVCTSIENLLPDVFKAVEMQLLKETLYPSFDAIKQLFVVHLARQLSPWVLNPQNHYLVADYVTPLILKRCSNLFKEVKDTTRDDSLAAWLAQISSKLDKIQQATVTLSTISPSAMPVDPATHPTDSVENREQSSNALLLAQKRQRGTYDVYISYNIDDETEVMDIGENLKNQGILPWLEDVRPGRLEMLQREEQILHIPIAIVVVGQRSIAGEQELQMYALIAQFVKCGIAVIPIILAKAPKNMELPPYLGNFTKVDFHRAVPDPMKQLIWGITGIHP